MRRRSRAVAVAGILAGVLAGVLALTGCGAVTPTAAPQSFLSPAASAAASLSSAGAPPSSAGALSVERTLLGILPGEVQGQPLRFDDETAAQIAASGDLAADIEAIAVGLYIQPGSSSADDLAIVNVVRLRPGVFSDAWFRSWQSTYDIGACEVAGGVEPGAAVSEIGGHETHIGSCSGGVHTYHVHLPSPDRVISITAAGKGRFGERVVAGLTE